MTYMKTVWWLSPQVEANEEAMSALDTELRMVDLQVRRCFWVLLPYMWIWYGINTMSAASYEPPEWVPAYTQ